ncbi:MAG: DUF1178 family protein [Pseudomonadota bacterium]
MSISLALSLAWGRQKDISLHNFETKLHPVGGEHRHAMIKYALKCTRGHTYDSWFGSSDDYDRLKSGGLLTCAVCGDPSVEKAIMAPRVTTGDVVPHPDPKRPPEEMLRALRAHVERTADNVGLDFAQEARRIDAGEAPRRSIFGEARPDEARSLLEDGIAILPLPTPQETNN